MADEKEEKQEGKKGGNSLVLIIVAVLLAVVLLLGGLIVVLLASGGDSGEQDPAAATTEIHAPAAQGGKPAAGAPKERSNDFLNVGPIYPLDQFLVNLLSETGSRYLKMTINIELSSELLTPEIEQKKPLLRDIVIRILSSKTYEDISTTKGKERLKDEIAAKINETLRDGYIKNVFFTDFIVQ
nr:flagellar basal body-associated protein FliL [uncultured Campylobacter sp.]